MFAVGILDWMPPVRTTALCGSLLLLPLGCGANDVGPVGVDEPADSLLVLQPNELCSDHSEWHIATFEDANLEAAIIGGLGIGAQEDLTCGLIYELAVLVLCSQSLFRFADLGDDGLCRGGPDKGCGVIVSGIDVVVDRLD